MNPFLELIPVVQPFSFPKLSFSNLSTDNHNLTEMYTSGNDMYAMKKESEYTYISYTYIYIFKRLVTWLPPFMWLFPFLEGELKLNVRGKEHKGMNKSNVHVDKIGDGNIKNIKIELYRNPRIQAARITSSVSVSGFTSHSSTHYMQ